MRMAQIPAFLSSAGGAPAASAAPEAGPSVLDLDPRGAGAARPSTATAHAVIIALALGLIGVLGLRAGSHTPVAPAPAVAPSSDPSDPSALQTRCALDEPVACNDLGVLLLRGQSIPRDPQAAVRAFVRACDGGSADGCSNLGAAHERGFGVSTDLDAARALYERACNGGNALGCSNLGALYESGRGLARDREAAQHLFELACETGSATGCSNLEWLLAH
jgi:TPR repeat protein